MSTIGGNSSQSVVQLSIYMVPVFLAMITFSFAVCALFAVSLWESMLHTTWNILYDFPSNGYLGVPSASTPKEIFVYVLRLTYLYRGSTLDFEKAHLVLVLLGVDDVRQTAFRVPWTFFSTAPGSNVHSKFEREGGTVKFLLIRERPLMHLEKVAITHDHVGAQLVCIMHFSVCFFSNLCHLAHQNLTAVEIHQTTKSEGYKAFIASPNLIESVNPKEAVKLEVKLMSLPLEGEFTLDDECTTVLDFTGPLYLFLSVVTYKVTNSLMNLYNWNVKPTYAKWRG